MRYLTEYRLQTAVIRNHDRQTLTDEPDAPQ